MITAQGLRKIARREWEAGNILVTCGLRIGVRFTLPYLRQPLQDWLNEEPEGEFAYKLYIIGMQSLDSTKGHGYVELTSRWVSAMYNFPEGARRFSMYFSADTTQEMERLLRRQFQLRIDELVGELEASLRAARHAGESSDELAICVRTAARGSLGLDELDGAGAFGKWATAFLASKPQRPDIMPVYI